MHNRPGRVQFALLGIAPPPPPDILLGMAINHGRYIAKGESFIIAADRVRSSSCPALFIICNFFLFLSFPIRNDG